MPLTPEVAERLEALLVGCEGILARPLKALERDLVLEWATTLRRGGELVPVEEVLEVVGRAMARPTPEGSLPANLRWCRDDVAALARSRPGPAVDLPRSVRESMSYDQELAQYAEQLRQEGR